MMSLESTHHDHSSAPPLPAGHSLASPGWRQPCLLARSSARPLQQRPFRWLSRGARALRTPSATGYPGPSGSLISAGQRPEPRIEYPCFERGSVQRALSALLITLRNFLSRCHSLLRSDLHLSLRSTERALYVRRNESPNGAPTLLAITQSALIPSETSPGGLLRNGVYRL